MHYYDKFEFSKNLHGYILLYSHIYLYVHCTLNKHILFHIWIDVDVHLQKFYMQSVTKLLCTAKKTKKKMSENLGSFKVIMSKFLSILFTSNIVLKLTYIQWIFSSLQSKSTITNMSQNMQLCMWIYWGFVNAKKKGVCWV